MAQTNTLNRIVFLLQAAGRQHHLDYIMRIRKMGSGTVNSHNEALFFPRLTQAHLLT